MPGFNYAIGCFKTGALAKLPKNVSVDRTLSVSLQIQTTRQLFLMIVFLEFGYVFHLRLSLIKLIV